MSKLYGVDNIEIASVPTIKSCVPLGSQILIELLTKQERSGSTILVTEGATNDVDPPQAYVTALGPKVPVDWVKVGDRVLLNGVGTFVPKYDDNKRQRLLVEPQIIKAILTE